MREKLILTDVDSVMLDYMEGVEHDDWLVDISEEEHWRKVAWLEPFRDAEEYVIKLGEDGWKFHAITAVGDHPQLVEYRMLNLKNIWGYDIFQEITCVPKGRYKKHILERYRDTGLIWIEDHLPNAKQGLELNLDCRLFNMKYNQKEEWPEAKRLNNWKELYEELTG
jgi:hypothetical protein